MQAPRQTAVAQSCLLCVRCCCLRALCPAALWRCWGGGRCKRVAKKGKSAALGMCWEISEENSRVCACASLSQKLCPSSFFLDHFSAHPAENMQWGGSNEPQRPRPRVGPARLAGEISYEIRIDSARAGAGGGAMERFDMCPNTPPRLFSPKHAQKTSLSLSLQSSRIPNWSRPTTNLTTNLNAKHAFHGKRGGRGGDVSLSLLACLLYRVPCPVRVRSSSELARIPLQHATFFFIPRCTVPHRPRGYMLV